MEIKILGCYGGADKNFRLTSFLVNGFLAVDAGSITSSLDFEEQKKITDIYISHIHMDHIVSLPFIIDNVFGHKKEPIRIHSHSHVIKHLREHLFNDICWPDFTLLPSVGKPSMEYVEHQVGDTFKIQDLEVTIVPVDHLVPTAGLIVKENGKSWIYPSDTGETDKIWEEVNKLDNPELLFLECSFPNRFKKLALNSYHLTPAAVARQLAKLDKHVPVRIYHCKPDVIEEIYRELSEINHRDLEMLKQGFTYKI